MVHGVYFPTSSSGMQFISFFRQSKPNRMVGKRWGEYGDGQHRLPAASGRIASPPWQLRGCVPVVLLLSEILSPRGPPLVYPTRSHNPEGTQGW